MILKNSSDINLTSQRRHKDVISVIFDIFTLKLTFNDLYVPKYQTVIEKIIAYLILNSMWIPKKLIVFFEKIISTSYYVINDVTFCHFS